MNFQNLQLHVRDLPKATDIQYEPLHKDYRSIRYLVCLIFSILFFIVGVVLFSFLGLLFRPLAWLALISGLLVFVLLCVFLIYKGFPRKGYAVRERDIHFKSGYIFSSVTSIPFARIQHCELDQGPIEKMFGLCSLQIYTAGGSSSDLVIPGLLYQDGDKLRSQILTQLAHNES